MELSADVHPALLTAVVGWAALHNLSVSAVVARAVTEYMLDVDSGLLSPPHREPRSLSRPLPRYMRRG